MNNNIAEMTPSRALTMLQESDYSSLLKYMAAHSDRDPHVWDSALETWLIWLAAHRHQSYSGLPMVLPEGPVADLHFASMERDLYEHDLICSLGAGDVLFTVGITDRNRGQYTTYRPLAKTKERMLAVGAGKTYQMKIWETNPPFLGQIRLFTVPRTQVEKYAGDWQRLWADLSQLDETKPAT